MNGPGRAAEQTRTEGATPHPPQGDTPPALMAQLFADQRHASRHEPPPPAEARRQALSALETMVRDHLPEIAQAISQDFGGRAVAETELLEAVPLLGAVRYARRHLARWMRPERRLVAWQFLPSRAYVRHEPLGVVGILSPWNYPLLLTLSPLVDALAAGNRALLKPSELTPCFSALLARLVSEAFPADRVAVVTGGPAVAAAFCALPFDHIVFTGSGAVARKVLAAAAPNLTPVTLELGGKSPAIVSRSASIAAAAKSIAHGKAFNSGQACVAPDYVLMPSDQIDEFVNALNQAFRAMYPDCVPDREYTSMASDRHAHRVRDLLADAEQKGAKVISCGEGDGKRIIPLQIVLGATPDMRVLQEELFNPILPVLACDSLEQAVHHVTARPRPLALYYYGNDARELQILTREVHAGGMTVNDWAWHVFQNDLPFGGTGNSGIGSWRGPEGFRALSHAKSVFTVRRWFPIGLFRPPYGNLVQRLSLRIFLGRAKSIETSNLQNNRKSDQGASV